MPGSTIPSSVAIVGIGCRLPGGINCPQEFMQALESDHDGVSEVPADRYLVERFVDEDVSTPGRAYTHHAGFLKQSPFEFDPAPFGISPREAELLDPQQRLLLEVTYEALEDAGISMAALAGTRTAVLVGGFTLDHMLRGANADGFAHTGSQTAFCVTMTTLSARLAHTFDTRGPCFTVDTACSASLVALHVACKQILSGECDRAIVAGVNVITDPYFSVMLSKGRFLSHNGRSKAFDASADGYGRGEGAGVVILESLDLAQTRPNHHIHALVRGTAVNHGGHTTGMALPCENAQKKLMTDACSSSGIDPKKVTYVEAHGTGTLAGDPVEARALGAVYGSAHDGTPVIIGSVKTNIGHLEAASGITGLIKATLSVREGKIFPQRLFTKLNPAIPFDQLNLRVALKKEEWPETAAERMAAVNSFGYGGTNAHAIVSQAPKVATPVQPQPHATQILLFSAFDAPALRERALQLVPYASSLPLSTLSAALARRPGLPHRAAIIAASEAEFNTTLDSIVETNRSMVSLPLADAIVGKVVQGANAKFAWIFTGMGPQWVDMGRELLAEDATFRKACEEVDVFFKEASNGVWSPLVEFNSPELPKRIGRNDVAQPLNFMLQVGLTEVLRSRGSKPDIIIGHSVGEVAAAWASGCLSLKDAVTLSWHRSRLQQLVVGGGMLAVAISEADATQLITSYNDVHIAAVNASNSVTLAGDIKQLTEIGDNLTKQNIFARKLLVEVAYHSAHMEPVKDQFMTALACLSPSAPKIPLISTVTGTWVTSAVHSAEYWWKNSRYAVHLMRATQTALEADVKLFLEVGPHPVLAPAMKTTAGSTKIVTAACLKRKEPELRTLLRALATLWCYGAPLHLPTHTDSHIDLPSYPWQRRRLWSESAVSVKRRTQPGEHALLDLQQEVPHTEWHTQLAGNHLKFMLDHVVDEQPILPAAAFIDAGLAAVRHSTNKKNTSGLCLLDMKLLHALRLNADTTFSVNIVHNNEVKMFARKGEDAWQLHATATLGTDKHKYNRARDISDPPSDATKISSLVLYNKLKKRGNDFGPRFRVLSEVYHSKTKNEAWAKMDTPLPISGWILHPVLLDATFQTALSLMVSSEDRPILPVSVERIQLFRPSPIGNSLRTHVVLKSTLSADIVLADATGVVAELTGFQCIQMASATSVDPQWLYSETWHQITQEPSQASSELLDIWRAPNIDDVVTICAALREKLNDHSKSLIIVTQSARAVEPEERVNPVHRALWGLIRTARTENSDRLLALVDMPPASTSADEQALATFTSNTFINYGDEVAVRNGLIMGAHITRSSISAPHPDKSNKQGAYELVQDFPGQLSALSYKGVARRTPAEGEVEIEVRAIGLNFKDLMKVMGMLSTTATENTFTGRTIGLECAGVITAAGPDSKYKIGDSVFSGMVRNGFGSHAILNEHFVKHVPSGMNFEQAASLFSYVTAWYGLVTAAFLARGEHVLIHSATGGVGLAAVYIAQMKGAIVHATAGSEEKRAWLKVKGVEYVYDSRTLNFAEEIRGSTKGRGVDVVLNSLAGPALEASVNVLAPGGRFVELGKQDIASNSKLALQAFNHCLSFISVDLDRISAFRPSWYSAVVDAVVEACTSPTSPLPALPLTIYDSGNVEEAFRFMAAAKHIGKIVLKFDPPNPPQVTPRHTVSTERSYLITGGVHGLGLAFATNLAALGARHLWLVGRRGVLGEEERRIVDDIRAKNINVHVITCDVTVAGEVEKLVASIQPPLAGVFHAAAYMSDEALDKQSPEEFAKVLRVKADGSLALHNATKNLDLHYFVMFSSIFSHLGNPKQAAYAAANSFMDGLAEMRRAEGLPGLAIAFGPISGVGMVNAAISKHLASLGVKSIPHHRALSALENSITNMVNGCIGVFDINWDRWIKMVPTQSWERLAELRERKATGSDASATMSPAALAEAIARAVSRVMRIAPVHTTPLREYGLDSIVAVELAAAIEAEAGIATSSIELISGVSVSTLVQRAVNNAAKKASAEVGKENVQGDIIEVQADLREWILDNICVQQPYFDLGEVEEDKETKVLRTTVNSGAHSPHELGEVSSAEVARHLAILGSGAARRHIGDKTKGRIYFPVEDAWLIENLMSPDQEWKKDQKYRVVAKCTGVDRMSSKAYAEASLWTLDEKTHLSTWGFAYHVIPAHEYEKIFEKHAQLTVPHVQGLQPYNRWHVLDTTIENGEVKAEIEVKPELCQGHFVGFPAFPVSIIMRHCVNLIGLGVGSKIHVIDFVVEAKRFAWAGETLTLVAAPDEDDRTTWCVEGRVGAEHIATFKLKIHYVRNASTFWRLLRRNVTGKGESSGLASLVNNLITNKN